jgi:hypothetical protein
MIGGVHWYFALVRGRIETIEGFWQVPIAAARASRWTKQDARHPFAPEVSHAVNDRLDDCVIVEW